MLLLLCPLLFVCTSKGSKGKQARHSQSELQTLMNEDGSINCPIGVSSCSVEIEEHQHHSALVVFATVLS